MTTPQSKALIDVAALRNEIGRYAVARLIRNVTSTAKRVDKQSDRDVRRLERSIRERLDRIEAALRAAS